jgi:hypothetical protein
LTGQTMGVSMRTILLAGSLVAALAATSFGAQAQILQGTQDGAANGAAQGNAVGGPIGGIVGGALGAGVGAATGAVGTATGVATGAVRGATGIVGGIFGADERPRFHDYVVGENYPSYSYGRPLAVGTVLPRTGVVYHQVPADYPHAHRYRFARVNDRTVVVDPRTRRVVDIID